MEVCFWVKGNHFGLNCSSLTVFFDSFCAALRFGTAEETVNNYVHVEHGPDQDNDLDQDSALDSSRQVT